MECKCKNGKFWIGLGLGTVIGAAAYYCAQTEKAKELRKQRPWLFKYMK